MTSSKLAAVSLLLALAPAARAEDLRAPLNPLIYDTALAKEKQPDRFEGVTTKAVSKNRYFLPTGFTFPARLENAIYSYNAETPAIAVVERPVEYLKRFVIPAGTKVIGNVSVQQSHDRVMITFHTLVFPEGDEVRFIGMALSLDGSAGVKGKVETHKDSAVANTVLRSVITGTQSAMLMAPVSPIAAQAAIGVSGEATRELDTQRQQQVTTSISVDAETPVRVYLPQRIEY